MFGWLPLFAELARELHDGLAGRGALVLEDAHQAWADSPTMSLVNAGLLPGLEGAVPCVILAHRLPPPTGTWKGTWRSASELQLPPQAAERMLDEHAPALTRRARDRAVTLTGGRAAVLAGLRSIRTATGGSLEPVLEGATSWQELLARVAQALLADAGTEARSWLALAARLGYANLDGSAFPLATGHLPAGPWLQQLEDGWVRVRACWQEPLRAVLGRRAEPGRDTLHQAAGWLHQAGANDQAISLYLEIGDPGCAARAMAGCATTLMDNGQWATLERWLGQLPDHALASHPDLIYCKADIAAACGHTVMARRWFDTAASYCSKRNDPAGACRSMLAASAVAADHGDSGGSALTCLRRHHARRRQRPGRDPDVGLLAAGTPAADIGRHRRRPRFLRPRRLGGQHHRRARRNAAGASSRASSRRR